MVKIIAVLFILILYPLHAVEDKLVLVSGCARSGTGYMCAFLKAQGLDVHHEYMGADGSVSWLLGATEAPQAPWGPNPKDYRYKHIFHQVRDPIKVIQSFYTLPLRTGWEWIASILPEISENDPLLTKCAKYWIHWNKMVEAKAELTFRIEDFDRIYQVMGKKLGRPFDGQVLKSISKKTNTKGPPKRVITWAILKKELDPQTFEELCDLAKHYGYQPASVDGHRVGK